MTAGLAPVRRHLISVAMVLFGWGTLYAGGRSVLDFRSSHNLKVVFDAGLRPWRVKGLENDTCRIAGRTPADVAPLEIVLPGGERFDYAIQSADFSVWEGNDVERIDFIGAELDVTEAAGVAKRICTVMGLSRAGLDEWAARLGPKKDAGEYAEQVHDRWSCRGGRRGVRFWLGLQPLPHFVETLDRVGAQVNITLDWEDWRSPDPGGAPVKKHLTEPIKPPPGYEAVSMDPPTPRPPPRTASTNPQVAGPADHTLEPRNIRVGHDGNLWFTLWHVAKLGSMTTAGHFREYAIPDAREAALDIASGADGNIWFSAPGRFEKVTPDGSFTQYGLPKRDALPEPITAGPDGNIWFIDGGRIGKVTRDGVVSEYDFPARGGKVDGIAAGPDGCVWFTDIAANKVGKVTVDGRFTEYVVPTPNSGPVGITAGSDGNLWFLERGPQQKVGKVTPEGRFTEYATTDTMLLEITAGPDGNLWFTGFQARLGEPIRGGLVGKVTTDGRVTEYSVPPTAGLPFSITAGPDRALWFTTQFRMEPGASGGKIVRLTVDGVFIEYALPAADGTKTPDESGQR